MNLGELIDFCGNLLDYDPTNATYRAQLVALLNDSQVRLLTDRHWAFAQRQRTLSTYADLPATVTLTNGSSTMTGAFALSADVVVPGSSLELAQVKVTLPAGGFAYRQIRYVQSAVTAHLDRPWSGATGAYSTSLRRREVYLPSDTATLMNVADPSVSVGSPRQSLFLSKWERDAANLDQDLEGTIEAYLPSRSMRVRAPQAVTGAVVAGGLVGQGVRTITVYMVNVLGPLSQNYPTYRQDVSNGFESAFSQSTSYELSATQSLTFTPEVLDEETGYYRRYYFTCAEAGILAPVRIRGELTLTGGVKDQDTVGPLGTITIEPNLALSHLQTQAFQSRAVRYRYSNGGAYRAVELYPHPSADQDLDVRTLIAPPRMEEDQDAPLMPEAYSQTIAYAALEQLTLKVDNPSLSAVYERKKNLLLRGLEARYLGEVPRRIQKGQPALGMRFYPNPFGPLSLT